MRRSAAPRSTPIQEKAVEDHIAAMRRFGIAPNGVVGDAASETIATAFCVKPKQMVAIGVPLNVHVAAQRAYASTFANPQGRRTQLSSIIR